MKKNWLLYMLLWQIAGIIVSMIIAFPKGNFHAFLYYLMFSLSFVNLVAVFSSAMLLTFERIVKDKIKSSFIVFSSIIMICVISIFAGIKIVPPVVHSVCSMEVAHAVDKDHIYMVAGNTLLSLLLLGAYSMIFIYHKLKSDLQMQYREIESLKRLHIEAKFAILQSKVNPHFLFNTLNSILDLVFKAPKKVEEIVLNLSHIYRRVLNLPDNEAIFLEDEIKLVKSYLEVEKIRFNERLQFKFTLENKLKKFKVPPLIIQTLVENAIIHGLSPKKEGGEIKISTKQIDDKIEIKVSDNGVGIKNKTSSSGFGLYGVQERLKLFYKDNAEFLIESVQQTGTEIRMIIPYEA